MGSAMSTLCKKGQRYPLCQQKWVASTPATPKCVYLNTQHMFCILTQYSRVYIHRCNANNQYGLVTHSRNISAYFNNRVLFERFHLTQPYTHYGNWRTWFHIYASLHFLMRLSATHWPTMKMRSITRRQSYRNV